ncbi:hypothetical protein GCM10011609_59800 [Lentzea pudingi]|uniref:Uncharacterized protein n=1 Tax=Lentzea pudingi TaxID=1789439 RepID=A0ABQ2IHQ8_9PSEU|nr:hypothetical protein GCM10011609_59800 [Lentzea pudingi]
MGDLAAMPVVLGAGAPGDAGRGVGIGDRERWVYSRFEFGWGGCTFLGCLVTVPEPWPGTPATPPGTNGPELGEGDRLRTRGPPARVLRPPGSSSACSGACSGHEEFRRVLSGENRVRPTADRQ